MIKNKMKRGMHLDIYEVIWFRFDLDSKSQGCQKGRNSVPGILQSFKSTWIEIVMLLSFVGLMNIICIISCLISNQKIEPYSVISF